MKLILFYYNWNLTWWEIDFFIFNRLSATSPPKESTSRRAKKIESTIRKIRKRNKKRHHHKVTNSTITSNDAKTVVNESLNTNSGNQSHLQQHLISPHYVTLEDLHKNHFNFSGKNGKLVKRKIRVKKLPAHLKGTRPTFVKLRYPNHLMNESDIDTNIDSLVNSNRTFDDKRCKYWSKQILNSINSESS